MQKHIVTGVLGFVSGLTLSAFFKRDASLKSFWDKIPSLPTTVNSIDITLDFDTMVSLYEAYGENGVYAYLVDNHIAKDTRHGNFIIKQLFLPEYEKYKKRPSGASPPLPTSDSVSLQSEEKESE